MSYFREVGFNHLRSGNFLSSNGAVPKLMADTFWVKSLNGNKHITFTVKNSNGVLVTNAQVKVGVFEYSTGIAFNYDWMNSVVKGVYTTSSTGVIDILYTGNKPIGDLVYVVVFYPNDNTIESLIWTQTILYT